MAFKNNYDLDTYNGDIGFVAGLVEVPVKDEGEETSEAVQDTLGDDFDAVPPKMEKFLKVMIDGREVFYPADHVDELQLAYCQTIHKSQGSEYPCVIVVLLNQHYTMLERNLIYTALTRAKKMGLFLASKSALGKAISRCQTKQRNSFLSSRIKLAAKEASLPCVGQVKTGIHLIA
jgi:exodeoxyribonuclease V alpha subunit